MADTKLLPCPFCGGTDLSIETNSVQPDDFHDAWVNCGECNADGRHAMTLEGWLPSKAEAKEEAVVAWNRRAALASRPAEVDDERQWVVVGGRRAGRTFLAALARDAERYRWMRNAQWFKAGIAKTELNASSFHYSGDLLDQLVDAGRAAGVHGEGAGK